MDLSKLVESAQRAAGDSGICTRRAKVQRLYPDGEWRDMKAITDPEILKRYEAGEIPEAELPTMIHACKHHAASAIGEMLRQIVPSILLGDAPEELRNIKLTDFRIVELPEGE